MPDAPSAGSAPILQKDNPFQGPSFSLASRLARLLWQSVWLLLFRPTPAPLHLWRSCC
jgi:putative colanic acid biosynthesis acetyltransferase WcaF